MSPLAHSLSPAKSMAVVGGGTMGVGIVYVFKKGKCEKSKQGI